MALKLNTTNIDGVQWHLNTLAATAGLGAFTQLTAIIGAPVGALAGGAKSNTGLLDMDASILGGALATMTKQLSDPSTVDLVKLLLGGLRKGPKMEAIDFDLEFAANYGVLTKLIGWALEVNFKSFFDGNPALSGFLQKVKASTLETSTGGSGE